VPILVTVERGGTPESEHRVEGAVVDATGGVRAATERPDRVTFFRSSSKPFQALPLVERGHADALGLSERLIALTCASHNGEPMHVEGARAILAACGRTEADLECGFHYPRHEPTAEWLRAQPASARTGVYNNCSGKHAGMVALAVREGWPVAGYTDRDHPVQRAGIAAIADACGVDAARLPIGVDGCSAANPAVSVLAMARGFARLAAARDDASGEGGARERAMARVRTAMIAHPDMVAGTGRFDTALMRVTKGRLVTKTGAEAVQCVAIPALGLGLAVKVVDGTRRAVAPAVVGWLSALGLLSADEARELDAYEHEPITNVRECVVGAVVADSFPAWRLAPAIAAIGSSHAS
jgi:L-asparaginase II